MLKRVKNSSSSGKNGFTMIELIAIVAILVTVMVMIPTVVRSATAQGKAVSCEENLKLIGAATIAYSADSDGWLPFNGLDWMTKGKIGGNMDAWIDGSVPSRNIERFACPADNVPLDKRTDSGNKIWVAMENGPAAWAPVSYGINLIVTGVPKHQYYLPHKIKDMEQPKVCFLAADATARDICEKSRFAFRHDGKKANTVFADGHVAALAEEAVPAWKSNLCQGFWVGGGDE